MNSVVVSIRCPVYSKISIWLYIGHGEATAPVASERHATHIGSTGGALMALSCRWLCVAVRRGGVDRVHSDAPYGGPDVPRTPHQRLASAGFSAEDTEILISIYDTVSAKYSDADINNIIIDALCTMAGAGSRSPDKLTAYVEHRARDAALAKYGAAAVLLADNDKPYHRPEPPTAA